MSLVSLYQTPFLFRIILTSFNLVWQFNFIHHIVLFLSLDEVLSLHVVILGLLGIGDDGKVGPLITGSVSDNYTLA